MTIQFKRSIIANRTPTLSDLKVGELAINLKDKKIFSTDGIEIIALGSNQEETDARYLKLSGGSLSGDLSLVNLRATGVFNIGTGAYKGVLFNTLTTPVIGNGELQITPQSIPGSGTSIFTTRFKEASIGGSGKTVHNVVVDGTLLVDKDKKVFHEGYQGVGTGLDAEKLAGINVNRFIRADIKAQTIGFGDISTDNRTLHLDGYNSAEIGYWATEDNGAHGAFYGFNGTNDSAEFKVRHVNMDTLVSATVRSSGVTDYKIAPTILGQKVWTQGNDGDSSGLDADLLDGKQGSAYVDITESQTINGLKTFTRDLTVSNPYPALVLVETDATNTPKWFTIADSGSLSIRLNNAGPYPLNITTDVANTSVTGIVLTAPSVTINGGKVWHSENDGVSSGLDADLLDGKQGSDYGVLSNTQVWTGGNTFNKDIYLNDGTNISPEIKFIGTSGSMGIDFFSNDRLRILDRVANTARFEFDRSTGNMYIPHGDLYIKGKKVWYDGNGGIGSGLDADMLDGKQGSFYQNATNLNIGTLDKARLPLSIDASTTGNSSTTDKLKTARTLTFTGVLSGTGIFDGSTDINIATSMAPNSVTIASVTGLQTALDAKLTTVPSKSADSAKLDGVDANGYMRQSRGQATDLNATIDRGQWFFINSATNRPADFGTLINYCSSGEYNGTNNWLSQVVHDSSGKMHTRQKTNAGGFTSWATHYTTMNKPSAADVNALATTTPYITLDATGNIDIPRMSIMNNPGTIAGYLRAPAVVGGFLPYSHNESYLGTSTWIWKAAYAKDFFGDLTGNASTATKLSTARSIALIGNVTGSTTFDGAANISINAIVADNSHKHFSLTGRGRSTINLNLIAADMTEGDLTYHAYNKSSTNSIGNLNDANGVITVGKHTDSSSFSAQLAFASDGKLYHRDNPSGGFGTWNKIYTTGDKPSLVELGAAATAHTHDYLPLLGKANNSGKLDDQLGSFYRNATNINDGTLNNARLANGSVPNRSINLGNEDLNTIQTPGFYHQLANSNAVTNYPVAHSGSLVVQNSAGITQQYHTYYPGNNQSYFRSFYNGVWTEWSKVWTSLNGGAASGLDADLLDGQQGSFYQNATNLNTGTIADARLPATISSNITGSAASAATATKLTTARSIILNGDVDTVGSSFDGTANATLTVNVKDDSHSHSNYVKKTGDTMTGGLQISSPSKDVRLLNLETATGWSSLQIKSGAALAHIAVNNGIMENSAAESLHFRPKGVVNGGLILQPNSTMKHQTSSGSISIGCLNAEYAHFQTDRPNFHFDKTLKVQGEIYAGSSYNQQVYHQGFIPSAVEVGALPITGGTITGNLTAGHIAGNGTGNDYHLGGLETRGNGVTNTVFPTVGFHQPGAYAASIQLHGATDFVLKAQGGTANADLTARYLKATNFGHGLVGLYSATKFQNVFSMGDAYKCEETGNTLANGYGIYWTHSNNTNDQARKITGHHAVFTAAGTTRSAIGDHIWTSGNVYGVDINSTGIINVAKDKYVEFAGNSSWGGALRVGGNGRSSAASPLNASVAVTNGNLHLDSGSDKETLINFYSGTSGIKFGNGAQGIIGSVDKSGNMAMSGKGTFNSLTVRGHEFISNVDTWIRTAGTDGIFFSGGGGGFHMLDGLWIRTYGGKQFHVASTANNAIDTAGGISAGQNITAYSDERIKTDITVIDNALDKISQIRGVTYTRTDVDSAARHTGVLAQELRKVLPEAVIENESDLECIEDGKLLSVAYGNVIGLLVEGIKEERSKREALEVRLARLEKLLGE